MDKEKDMNIYYFSGTGNSLFIASEIQKAIPGADLRPMNSFVASAKVLPASESIGFVFPIHGFGLPAIVSDFIKKLDLASVKYIFAVATRGGSPTLALNEIDILLKKKDRRLNSFSYVNMPNNSYFVHDLNTLEEMNAKLKDAAAEAAKIVDAIKNGKEGTAKDPELNFANVIVFRILRFLLVATRYLGFGSAFYVDSACTGCRICEVVCPSGKIAIADGRPSWRNRTRCDVCVACVNYCPTNAIHNRGLKTSLTFPAGRYHHPGITANQIARQKE
jgi:ferredoxin